MLNFDNDAFSERSTLSSDFHTVTIPRDGYRTRGKDFQTDFPIPLFSSPQQTGRSIGAKHSLPIQKSDDESFWLEDEIEIGRK